MKNEGKVSLHISKTKIMEKEVMKIEENRKNNKLTYNTMLFILFFYLKRVNI